MSFGPGGAEGFPQIVFVEGEDVAEDPEGYLLDLSLEILDFTDGAQESVFDDQPVVQVGAGNAAAD